MPAARVAVTKLTRATTAARGIVFAGQFVALDLCVRGRAVAGHTAWSWAGAAASIAIWSSVFAFRTSRVLRVVAAGIVGVGVACDVLVARYYGALFDRQMAASAVHGWVDVRPVALRLLPLALVLAAAALLVQWKLLAPTPSRPCRVSRAVPAIVGVLAACAIPTASLTPELRAMAAATVLWAPRASLAAAPAATPVLESRGARAPDVLLVLTESVRASSYCTESGPECVMSPEVSALLPDRMVLRQMRSVASYTALSISAILTGRAQDRPREELAGAPTLFDYAHAARVAGGAPWVGYWSAQSADVLERDPGVAVDSRVTLETLVGRRVADEDDVVDGDIDRSLADRFERDIGALPHPLVLVLHLMGTHAPYFVDPARAPFQPAAHVVSWEGMGALSNAYADAIIAQDHTLARCIRAFLAAEADRPWLILFTSDHGEAFGEHGAIHHGQNLYDEQIHVPGWIAASAGALTSVQRANLARYADAFVTHLDVLPTLLDAIGVWDAPALASFRSELLGRSLLLPVRPMGDVPMTNCTARFPCPLNTWGLMRDGLSVVAQPWDSAWRCEDLRAAAPSRDALGCERVARAAKAFFPRLPNGAESR